MSDRNLVYKAWVDFKNNGGVVAIRVPRKRKKAVTDVTFYPSGRKRKRKNKRTSIPLPINWCEIRTKIIERDKVCRICGNAGQGIHHIDKNRDNNNLDNLIFLCWPCHRDLHHATIR